MTTTLPHTRDSITHAFTIGRGETALKVFATVGVVDGEPVELFLKCKSAGSMERGLLHSLALVISLAMRGGVGWRKIAERLRYMEFEPRGFTSNEEIPQCRSVCDYLGQWLLRRFG